MRGQEEHFRFRPQDRSNVGVVARDADFLLCCGEIDRYSGLS